MQPDCLPIPLLLHTSVCIHLCVYIYAAHLCFLHPSPLLPSPCQHTQPHAPPARTQTYMCGVLPHWQCSSSAVRGCSGAASGTEQHHTQDHTQGMPLGILLPPPRAHFTPPHPLPSHPTAAQCNLPTMDLRLTRLYAPPPHTPLHVCQAPELLFSITAASIPLTIKSSTHAAPPTHDSCVQHTLSLFSVSFNRLSVSAVRCSIKLLL